MLTNDNSKAKHDNTLLSLWHTVSSFEVHNFRLVLRLFCWTLTGSVGIKKLCLGLTAIPLTPTNLLPIVSQSAWRVKMNNFTHIATIIVYAHTVAITTQKFTLQSTELTDNLFFTDLICDVGNIFPRLWQSFRRKQNTITLPNMWCIRCSLFQLPHEAGFPFFLLCVYMIFGLLLVAFIVTIHAFQGFV